MNIPYDNIHDDDIVFFQDLENLHVISQHDQIRSILSTDYFIENEGQVSDSNVQYYSIIDSGFLFIQPGKLTFSFIGTDLETDIEYVESLSYEFIDPIMWQPRGLEPLNTSVNYFSRDTTLKDVSCYRGLIFDNVWEGIDFLLYHDEANGIRYEFHLGSGSAPGDIRLKIDGCRDAYLFDGDLVVEGRLYRQSHTGLRTFYEDNGVAIESEYFLTEDSELSFSIGDHDIGKAIVIDPLINSTFLGGSGEERSYTTYMDGDDVYISGETFSPGFPTTPGCYQISKQNYSDVFLLKTDENISVIDYSTFIGGYGVDSCTQLTMNSRGELVLVGETSSYDFPVTSNAFQPTNDGTNFDAFIIIFNLTRNDLDYSTYLGGSSHEIAKTVCLDENDNIFVAGITTSEDFPLTPDALMTERLINDDSFFAKFSCNGTLLNSTYYSGYNNVRIKDINYHDDQLFFMGDTTARNLTMTDDAYDRTHNGEFDIVFGVLDSNLSTLLYCSYFGGIDDEMAGSFVIDGNDLIMTGSTESDDFPIRNAIDRTYNYQYDCFLTGFNITNNFAMLYSTYLGGKQIERGKYIECDPGGNINIVGWTASDNFPMHGHVGDSVFHGEYDCFILKVNRSGDRILYSSYLGGTGDDRPYSLAVAGNGDAIITGYTKSNNFPVQTGSIDRSYNGYTDVFVARYNFSYPPGPPRMVGHHDGDGYVNISWKTPVDDGGASIIRYHIYRSRDNSSFEPISSTVSSFFYNDTDVTNGLIYYYRVNAENIAGSGSFSRTVSARPLGVISPPYDVLISTGDSLVELTWKPPLYLGGGTLLSTRVFRREGDQDFGLFMILDGNITSLNDTEVQNGVEYSYYLTCTNEVSESIPSDIVSGTPMTIPDPPVNLSILTGPGFAYLEWAPPPDDGGSEIVGYKIFREDIESNLLDTITTRQTCYNDTHVANGNVYVYCITAVNSVGESAPSTELSGMPLDRPSPPESFIVEGCDGYNRLTWDAPSYTGGTSIVSYRIYRGLNEDSLSPYATVERNISEYIDDSVTNGVIYHYSMSALNVGYESDMTVIRTARPLGFPTPPVIEAVRSGDSYIHLFWQSPVSDGGDPEIEYLIFRGTYPESLELMETFDSVIFDFNDTDVENGVEYYYYIIARNSRGNSNPSNMVSKISLGRPSPIRDLRSVSGNGYVLLHWCPPLDDGGANITGITIYRKMNDDGFMEYQLLQPDSVFFNDTDVTNGCVYEYYIVVINLVGSSLPSEHVQCIPRGPPFSPASINVTVSGDCVIVRWSAPTNDGGSRISSYRIYRKEGNRSYDLVAVIRDGMFTWTDEDLEGGYYSYMISGVNEFGEGEPIYSGPVRIDRNDRNPARPYLPIFLIIFSVILFFSVFAVVFIISKRRREHIPPYDEGCVTPVGDDVDPGSYP